MKAEERRKRWNRCERNVLLGLVRPRVGELEPQVGEGGEAANDRAVFRARPQQNEGKTGKTSWERAERRERSAAGADSRALGGRVAPVGLRSPRFWARFWGSGGELEGSSKVPARAQPRGAHLRRPTIEQQFRRDFGGRMER